MNPPLTTPPAIAMTEELYRRIAEQIGLPVIMNLRQSEQIQQQQQTMRALAAQLEDEQAKRMAAEASVTALQENLAATAAMAAPPVAAPGAEEPVR